MRTLNMTLARHNELKAHYNGKATGIQQELKDAGFDLKRDYSMSHDKATGDLIFIQTEPIQGTITAMKVDPEVKWTENFAHPKEKKPISKVDLAKKKLALIQKRKGKK